MVPAMDLLGIVHQLQQRALVQCEDHRDRPVVAWNIGRLAAFH
jgi:hypothetical protein